MPANAYLTIITLYGDQRLRNLRTEKSVNTISPVSTHWQIVQNLTVVTKNKVDVRVPERQTRERLDNMPLFGLSGFQKTMPNRGIKKEVLNFYLFKFG